MKKISNVGILAISSVIPKNKISIKSYSKKFGEKRIEKIIKNTGIESVRVVNKNINSSDLCYEAANVVLEKLNFKKSKIDGLVYVSQTRDYIMPQTSFILRNKLGLSENVICYDLPLGCTGFIQGLFQASLMVSSGNFKNVLLLCGDTISKYLINDDISTKSVFGDGGSACIIGKNDSSMKFDIKSSSENYKAIIMDKKNHGDIIQNSNKLAMEGLEVFNFVMRNVPSLIKKNLIDLNKTLDDFYNVFFHQANSFINNYLNRSLKLSNDKSPIILDGFGNTGPASIPLAINETLYKSEKGPTILCGFGVGLSYGTCFLNLNNTMVIKTKIYTL